MSNDDFDLNDFLKCFTCNDLLYEYNISDNNDYKKFIKRYHPDKTGEEKDFVKEISGCYSDIFSKKKCEKHGYDKVYPQFYTKIFIILFFTILIFGNIYLTKLSFINNNIDENQFSFLQLCAKIFIVILYFINGFLFYIGFKLFFDYITDSNIAKTPKIFIYLFIFTLFFICISKSINYIKKLAFAKNIDELEEINDSEYYIIKLISKIIIIFYWIICLVGILSISNIFKTYLYKFINFIDLNKKNPVGRQSQSQGGDDIQEID